MKLSLLSVAIVAALAVAGCNTQVGQLAGDVIIANNALAKVAQNDLPKACATIAVAEGYYADVQFLVPQSAQIAEKAAATIVNDICSHPPTNIVAAFTALNKAWATIQARTTVPK